jgi:pilus assembly protein Flp/PilA
VNGFLRDRGGVTAIEYGLLVALMTLAIIGAINTLGQTALTQLFNKIASSL